MKIILNGEVIETTVWQFIKALVKSIHVGVK